MMNEQFKGDQDPSVRLSVLIVTFNSQETIVNCIASAASDLQGIAAEIIVVDNHSSDGTAELLEALTGEYPNLSVELNRTNRGFAVGNNQALAKSVGQDVLILNPDTMVQAGAIKGLLKELEQGAQIGLVAPQLRFPDGRIQKTCRRLPRHSDVVYHSLGLSQLFPQSPLFSAWKMGDFDHQSRRQVDQPAGAAMLIRGELVRKLDGFDPNFPMFFNDVDLCKRILDAGYQIWYLPEYIITHVGGASVKQVKIKMTLSSHVSFFRYFEKHFTRLYQQPSNFLIGVLLYLSLLPRILLMVLRANKSKSSRETL